MRPGQVAFIALAVRVSQALLTQTFFQPDEYFQSLEVAHRAVFGYGQLTWEWSIDEPIRSILFPSLWIPLYFFLSITGLHHTSALVSEPYSFGFKVTEGSWIDLGSKDIVRNTGLNIRHGSLSALPPVVWSKSCTYHS